MDAIRALTADEVAAYRDKGWVHVPGLMSSDLAADILRRARGLMGDQALATSGAGGGDPQFAHYHSILRNYLGVWKIDEVMRAISHSPALARIASQLLHGRSIRFFNDEILVKPPISAGGKTTPWHQDLPHTAFERTGMVNIWISLIDLPKDGGAMSFLSGSHHCGPLGRTLLDQDDVVDQNPWLLAEHEVAMPPAMKAGDATIHGDMTIHSGPAFAGSHWRWAYLVNLVEAGVRYAGGPSYGEQIEGLAPNDPLPDDRFPILYPEGLAA